jgi:molybdenum cofactor cytidylyltransferase
LQHIAAILLAAGQSKRMGSSKQLLELADKPVIRWCLDALLDAGLKNIIVVLGPTGQAIIDPIKDYPLEIVWNTDPESDMAGSVKAGLKALGNKISAILVFPVDHPLVAAETIKTMINTNAKLPDKIIIPTYNDRKGHPVIFPRTLIEEIFTLPTLRDIIHKEPQRVHLAAVHDDGIILNMNTPPDHQKIQNKLLHSGLSKSIC